MPTPEGSFVWHDLVTTDVPGAKAFYPPITSWTTQPWEDAATYTTWVNDGVPLGGVGRLSDEQQTRGTLPKWMPYVYVYDVDACVRLAVKLGGQTRRAPKEAPNVGCWAVISDPQGAAIGVYEPPQSPPAPNGDPRRGEFSWHELPTSDYTAAFDFYSKLFHWERISEFDMGAMGSYFIFGQKGRTYGGMFNGPPDAPSPAWLSYVHVDDVKVAAEQIKQAGGVVDNGPMEVPSGDWVVMARDPQGARFALQSPKV